MSFDFLQGPAGVVIAAVCLLSAVVLFGASLKALVNSNSATFAPGPSQRERSEADALSQSVARKGDTGDAGYLGFFLAHCLSQSRASFWFSIFSGALGIVVIIFALFIFPEPASKVGLVQLLSGFIINAVSSIYIVQWKGLQQSTREAVDRIRKDRERRMFLEIVEKIEDRVTKDQLLAQLVAKYVDGNNLYEPLYELGRHGRKMG
jgi:hypothetical protein